MPATLRGRNGRSPHARGRNGRSLTRPKRPLTTRSRPKRPLAYAAETAAHHTLAAETAARLRGRNGRSPHARGRNGRSLTRGLPCPRTPAALRCVGSASAACASSRYSRCGMTLRAPVAFSLRHPALSLWRCYAQGFAAPRAPLRPPRGATRRVGLALIVPPSALALVFHYFACHPLARHHRFWALSTPWGLRAFSGSSLCPRL